MSAPSAPSREPIVSPAAAAHPARTISISGYVPYQTFVHRVRGSVSAGGRCHRLPVARGISRVTAGRDRRVEHQAAPSPLRGTALGERRF